MSPRTKEQFESIRANRKSHILEVSLEVFANKGYHQSAISQIAKEAGISKGLIYNYFENKEQLLMEVLEDGIRHLLKIFFAKNEQLDANYLKELIQKSFNLMEEDEIHWRLYFSVVMQADVMMLFMPKFYEIAMPVFENLSAVFSAMGFEEPMNEARVFGAILDGLGMNYLMDPENFPKEYCIKRLCDLYNLNKK
ncbi:MAG: TetR family transcriptional regulator [Bacteroidales bacterium]|nr:TetR family transcriptional regulator [Bacteroidales bacterium]